MRLTDVGGNPVIKGDETVTSGDLLISKSGDFCRPEHELSITGNQRQTINDDADQRRNGTKRV